MGNVALHARITAAAAPDRLAVVAPDGALRWGDVLDRAARLATRLGARDSPVLVVGEKEPAVVVAFLAAVRTGRAYVPVDPSLPAARVADMIAATEPGDAVLVGDAPPAVAGALAARGIASIALDPLAARCVDLRAADAPRAVDPARPAYVVFTSGTTGRPKGVAVPYRALEHFVDWLLATHRFAPAIETFLNQAPFGFDLSVIDLWGALATGGTLFAIARAETADPRRLFRRLDRAPLTTWVSTPSFARLCLAEPAWDARMLPALRRFLFCGETLPPAVVRGLMARFPGAEVWNMYGPTETTVAVTAVRISAALAATDRPLPVGRPAPGADVWVADPDDPARRLAPGARGEIVIAGPQVATGYLPPAPPGGFFTLADGRRAYRTGDLGTIDAGGSLHCAGRLDRQIKLRGYRLELEEIEAHLRGVPGVADAGVFAVERDGRPDHLVAVVVGAPSADPPLPTDRRALAAHVRGTLAASLPEWAIPRIVRRAPALPLTPHGKLDRRALHETPG
jgi:D-alanine--poly(phosphoribitol) ligase subunit 1